MKAVQKYNFKMPPPLWLLAIFLILNPNLNESSKIKKIVDDYLKPDVSQISDWSQSVYSSDHIM